MSRLVLDASAALAILAGESGAETLIPHLGDAAISTVNLAEVQGKLVDWGMPPADAEAAITHVVTVFFDFNAEQAAYAGSLVAKTKSYGLSLGDRCCLALASRLQAPVYTTDRAWKNLKLGFPIYVIR